MCHFANGGGRMLETCTHTLEENDKITDEGSFEGEAKIIQPD